MYLHYFCSTFTLERNLEDNRECSLSFTKNELALNDLMDDNAPCKTICDFSNCWSITDKVLPASFTIVSQYASVSLASCALHSPVMKYRTLMHNVFE